MKASGFQYKQSKNVPKFATNAVFSVLAFCALVLLLVPPLVFLKLE